MNAGNIERRTPEDSLSYIIFEDFHGRKEIYNLLKESSDKDRVPNLYNFFREKLDSEVIETVLIALEKLVILIKNN